MYLFFLALLPAFLLVIWTYRQDEVEKEPKGLIIKILFLGALSIIPTFILELVAGTLIEAIFDTETLLYVLVDNFIGVALIEELCKMKAAKWGAWKNTAFNYKFDAIVYCVSSALGFAAVENIMYVMDSGFSTALARAVFSVPSHAIDGLIMGYFFGLAKEAEFKGLKKQSKRYLRLSVIMPAIEHGIFDSALSLDSSLVFLFFIVFVVFIDIWALIFIKRQRRADEAIVLPLYYSQPIESNDKSL